MDPPPPVARTLWGLAGGAALLVLVARGIPEASRPISSRAPAQPVRLDLARDPRWKLTLLPGIGHKRAAQITRLRAQGGLRGLEDLRGLGRAWAALVERIRATPALRVLVEGRPVACAHERSGTGRVRASAPSGAR